MIMEKTVLITGCSTGIGRDLAEYLTEGGYQVIATARRLETISDLKAALKLSLDVTDNESIQEAVSKVSQEFGRIDILINNAGYAIRGAVEEITDDRIHQMFDQVLMNQDSVYTSLYQSYLQITTKARRHEPGPEVVSRVVRKAIETPKPKARYKVAVPIVIRLLARCSDNVKDFLLKIAFQTNIQ